MHNPEVKRIIKLGRKKHRDAAGQFIIEGLHLIDMALVAQAPIACVYHTEAFAETEPGSAILTKLAGRSVSINTVTSGVLKKMADTETPQGILAVVDMLKVLDWDLHMQGGPFVILDRIQDPGNLGTILRTADSAGANGVILLTGTVDAYNPKVIRSSMGSIFNVPFCQNMSFVQAYKMLKRADYTLTAADMGGEMLYYKTKIDQRTALVMGNEGQGIADDIIECIDVSVRIPLIGKSESLNVSVACGILLYEILRQNRIGQDRPKPASL